MSEGKDYTGEEAAIMAWLREQCQLLVAEIGYASIAELSLTSGFLGVGSTPNGTVTLYLRDESRSVLSGPTLAAVAADMREAKIAEHRAAIAKLEAQQ